MENIFSKKRIHLWIGCRRWDFFSLIEDFPRKNEEEACNINFVNSLLKSEALPSQYDRKGKTPLSIATDNNLEEIAILLLESSDKPASHRPLNNNNAGSHSISNLDEMCKRVICPISLETMKDPVILQKTQQTYERAMIEQWLQTNDTCPVTNIQLYGNHTLIPNIAVLSIIDCLKDQGLLEHTDYEATLRPF